MKKMALILLAVIFIVPAAKSQFTKLGAGLGFNTGFHFNNEKFPDHKTGNPVIFLKGIYELSLPIHISPSISIFMPNVTKVGDATYTSKLSIRAFSIDINGHYVFNSLDRFEFYGLAGLNFLLLGRKSSYESVDLPEPQVFKEHDNAFGLNLGAGSYMKITDTFDCFVELKYILSSQGQFVATGGVLLNIDWMIKHENTGM
jgi:opacity protein-like surface antigen